MEKVLYFILTYINDSTFRYNTVGGNCIRKVVGNKLEKIASEFTLKKTSGSLHN